MEEKESVEAADLYAGNVSTGVHASLHPLVSGARAVLFDAGGTLSHPDWERIALLAKREAGRDFTAAQMRRALYESLRAVDARLFEETFRASRTRRPGWGFQDMFCSLGFDE